MKRTLLGRLVIAGVLLLLVTGGLESTARAAPKPGAATAPALVTRLGKAVDSGDGPTVLACFDLSVPNGRTYPDYLVAVAAVHLGQNAVRAKADAYGAAVRAKVDVLIERWALGSYEYGISNSENVVEGSQIYPPGLKVAMAIVKKRGVFLFDSSRIFTDPDQALKDEEDAFIKIGAEWSKAAASAVSADDLIAKLTRPSR